jgi:hypothetical protein
MRRTVALGTLVAGVTLACPAVPADLPKEGSYDFTSCFAGTANTMEFSQAHTANTSEIRGTSVSNPPGGLFDKVAFRCIALNYTADGKPSGTTLCEGVDKDGDKYLSQLVVIDGSVSTRKIVAGTGKYEGLTSSGKAESLGQFGKPVAGQIQGCVRQTGTYKMK